jgi:hypothetical protein
MVRGLEGVAEGQEEERRQDWRVAWEEQGGVVAPGFCDGQ